MDKALVFGTKDCRFESCQGHAFLATEAIQKATGFAMIQAIGGQRAFSLPSQAAQVHVQVPSVPTMRSSILGQNSATGTRTRVARVRAEYPNQLDYSGFWHKAVAVSGRGGGERSESHRMLLTGAFLQDPLCHSEGLRLNGEAQAAG